MPNGSFALAKMIRISALLMFRQRPFATAKLAPSRMPDEVEANDGEVVMAACIPDTCFNKCS